MTATTHNPFDESHPGELLEGKLHEQFLWEGVGNGPGILPRLIVPDKADSEHVYQAVRTGTFYVITLDRKTMLRHAESVQALCGVQLVHPIDFQKLLQGEL